MSEFGEFGNLPTAPDPAFSPSFSAPAQQAAPRRSIDWAKLLPALGLVAGALHGHRARKKLMDLTGEHVSRRRILDESLYGATLGWVPQVLKDAKDSMIGQDKTAGVGLGAGIGNMLLGPLGAGVGAAMEKDPDRKYMGSPALRAAGGSSLGMALGLGLGVGLVAARKKPFQSFRDALTPSDALTTALLTAGGSTAGAVLGAKSVNSKPYSTEVRKTAGVGTGAVLGNLGFGPLGAGLGAEISKDDRYRYHGSPGVRAAVGSVGGGLGGLGVGVLLGAALANRHRGDVLHPTTGVLAALLAGGGSTYGAYAGAKTVDRTHRDLMPKHAAFRPFASKKSVGGAALRGAGVGAAVGGAVGAAPGAALMASQRNDLGRALGAIFATAGGIGGAAAGAPTGAVANAARAVAHNARVDRDRATAGKGLLLASGAVALGAGGARLATNKEKKADASALRVALGAAAGSALGHGIKLPAMNELVRAGDPGGALAMGLFPLGTILSGSGARTQGGGKSARTLAMLGHLSGDLVQHVGHLGGAHPAAIMPLPALGAALGAGIGRSRELAAQKAKRNLMLGAGATGLAGATGIGLALANRKKDGK